MIYDSGRSVKAPGRGLGRLSHKIPWKVGHAAYRCTWASLAERRYEKEGKEEEGIRKPRKGQLSRGPNKGQFGEIH
jgi:hypothetical protein